MDNTNFKNQLTRLIEELKNLNSNTNNTNASYNFLIDKLCKLSIENLESQRDLLLYFLIDSYDGDKEIANKVIDFLSLYSTKNRGKASK